MRKQKNKKKTWWHRRNTWACNLHGGARWCIDGRARSHSRSANKCEHGTKDNTLLPLNQNPAPTTTCHKNLLLCSLLARVHKMAKAQQWSPTNPKTKASRVMNVVGHEQTWQGKHECFHFERIRLVTVMFLGPYHYVKKPYGVAWHIISKPTWANLFSIVEGYFMQKDIDKRDYARCVCSNQQSYIVRDTSQDLCQSHTTACWLSLLLLLSTKYFVEYD